MQTENKTDQERLAERFVELRTQRRFTQKECADALGIGQSSYAEMESGDTRIRRRDMVTLAVFYGLTLEDAFPGFEVAA